jgi:hypothetical protein
VEPANATNKTITWTVTTAGTTGAVVSGSTFTASAAGTVAVTAAVANGLTASTPYTKQFTITVSGGGSPSPFLGTWTGDGFTIIVTEAGWEATPVDGYGDYKEKGTWTPTGSNTAMLAATHVYWNGEWEEIPAESLIPPAPATVSGNTLTGTNPITGEPMTLTKGSGSNPSHVYITVGFNLGTITITGGGGDIIIRKTGYPQSVTLSAAEYSNVVWYVDGAAGIADDTLTIDAQDYNVQIHSVTFTGYKNGAPYARTIPFLVTN